MWADPWASDWNVERMVPWHDYRSGETQRRRGDAMAHYRQSSQLLWHFWPGCSSTQCKRIDEWWNQMTWETLGFSFWDKIKSELVVFLEMQEGFKFTQMIAVVFAFSITEYARGRRNNSFFTSNWDSYVSLLLYKSIRVYSELYQPIQIILSDASSGKN